MPRNLRLGDIQADWRDYLFYQRNLYFSQLNKKLPIKRNGTMLNQPKICSYHQQKTFPPYAILFLLLTGGFFKRHRKEILALNPDFIFQLQPQ